MLKKQIHIPLFVFALLRGYSCYSQSDSLPVHYHKLPQFTYSETHKVLFDPGLRVRTEATDTFRTLAQLLQHRNVVFVKSYGPGLLSSLSLRGTEAVHTPIIWRGFTLQNTVNATPDPGMESVPENYKMSLLPGGQSGLFGSGAIGGTLQVNPVAPKEKGIHGGAGLEFGSFNRNNQFFHLAYKGNRDVFSAGVRLYSTLNNFPYVNRTFINRPTERLENAAARGYSLNADYTHQLKKYGEITTSIWYQVNKRQIPGTMITGNGKAKQIDKNLRSMIGWKHTFREKHSLSLKSAFLYDYLFYNEHSLPNPSFMIQYASLSQAEYVYSIHKNHSLMAGVNHAYYKVFMSEYQGISPQRNQTTLFLGYRYLLPKQLGEAAIQAVEEITDGQWTPFCPSLSVRLEPVKSFSLRMRINRNYRQPSFNDLYWFPGGNPNLKPETGLAQELGAQFEKNIESKNGRKFSIYISSTGFHQTIQNRIVWIPGPLFWTPENIDRTRGFGNESDIKFGVYKNNRSFVLEGHYSYTKAVRAKPRFEGDPAFGKQLPNIPMYLGSVSATFSIKRTTLYYVHRFTGLRFTLADNSAFIPSFHTGAVGIRQAVYFLGFKLNAWFELDNLTNTRYEIIEFRPMPGRNFRVGVSLGFHKILPEKKR